MSLYLLFQTAQLLPQTNSKADSLKAVLELSDDIKRVNVLNRLAELYKTSDPINSFSYASEALGLSASIDYHQGQILAHEYYVKARELADKKGEFERLIVINENIALTYIEQDEFHEALSISAYPGKLKICFNFLIVNP